MQKSRKTFHSLRQTLALLLLACGLAATPAFANGPGLSYSGRLTDLHGKPVEGPVDISVKFWSSSSDGVQLGPTVDFHQAPLAQGVFQLTILLKPQQLAQVFGEGSTPVYIEITAAGKIYPRQQFLATPFALRVPVDPHTLTYNSDGNLTLIATAQPQDGQFLTKDASGSLVWATPSSSATRLNDRVIGSQIPAAGQALVFDGTNWAPQTLTTTTISTVGPLAVTGASSTPTLSLTAASSVSSGYITAQDYLGFSNMLSKSGGTMAGSLNMAANTLTNLAPPASASDASTKDYVDTTAAAYLKKDGSVPLTAAWNVGTQDLTSVGNVTLAAAKTLGLGVYATDPSGLAPADKGRIWFNSTSAQIKYYDGLTAVAVGAAGSGVTSVNGNAGSSQVIAIGSSGTAPAMQEAGATHTINIPQASAASVTGGLISNADYIAFSAKQNAGNYLTALTGDLTAAGPGAAVASLAATGVGAGSYAKVTVDTKGRVTAGTSLLPADIPALPASIIGSGVVGVANGGTGAATIANHGVVIGAGTGALSGITGTNGQVLVADASNQPVFAAISLGSSAAVAGTLQVANGGTGVGTAPGNGQLLIGNGTGFNVAGLTAGTGISVVNTSGGITINASADAATKVSKAGDTMTGALTLPANGLIAGTNQLVIAAGNVGIGTTAPASALQVGGAIVSTLPSTVAPSGTTQTIDWSRANIQKLSLASAAGNVTLTFSNAVAGGVYTLEVVQGATPYDVVWPAAVKWAAGYLPVITTTNGATDLISIFYDGSTYFATASQNF